MFRSEILFKVENHEMSYAALGLSFDRCDSIIWDLQLSPLGTAAPAIGIESILCVELLVFWGSIRRPQF